jgi:hypothetical protein
MMLSQNDQNYILIFIEVFGVFGYITIDQPDIRFRDYYRYREYYCGLCCTLKRKYGQTGRMSLGYDMTFLAVLLDGVYDSETRREEFRCIAHPFSKRYRLENSFTDYAADMNLYLTYLKCLDDWNDDRNLVRRLYSMILSRRIKKIEKKYPEKTASIRKHLDELSEFEKSGSSDFEGAAGCFGRVSAEVFSYGGIWNDHLARMGFFLGKFIYILDAFDDLEKDRSKGRYNPLDTLSREDDFPGKVKTILMSMISEAADEFETLPVDENMDILRNIIYAGVWKKFNDAVRGMQNGSTAVNDAGTAGGEDSGEDGGTLLN